MKKTTLIYTAIVAVCFLYTGSAYMSQMYVLTNFFDDTMVDIITSGVYYILQALGMLALFLCLRKRPEVFGKKALFVGSLVFGIFMMIGMLLLTNPVLMLICACIFNFLCGIYFCYYLTMLAANVPGEHLGFCYGIAYALASVGTYLFSLIKGGEFLTSKEIIAIYTILAAVTAALVMYTDNISPEKTREVRNEKNINFLIPIIILMTIVSTLGSSLFLSIPFNDSVNFTLVRAFYGIGLIAAGFIIDKSRFIGSIVVLASFTYPLIATALLTGGSSNTVYLIISYICIGFFSVYRVTAFADIGPLFACVGLMISRAVEAVVSVISMSIDISITTQLIITALIYLPLIILFMIMTTRRTEPVKAELTDEQKFAIFSDHYGFTAREAEVFRGLTAGLTDDEIAANCFISKNTVRFHVSNILKKTETASRTEAVRLFTKS